MKKILVISWFYPPINSSEGIVTYKLLKNSNYKYIVFTQKDNTSWSYGSGERNLESSNVEKMCSKASNLKDWGKEAVEYYKEHQNEFDIIMSRSMPPASHEAGLEIKRINPKIKWIASFGDPIADNPYNLLLAQTKSPYSWDYNDVRILNILRLFSPRRILKNFIWKIRYSAYQENIPKSEDNLEKDIIANADVVLFNNEQQQRYMLKKKTAKKSYVLPHSYDKSLYPILKKKIKGKKVKMVFLGHSDNIRTAKPLLEAVLELTKIKSDLADRLEIDFFGNLADRDKLFIMDNYLTDIVKFKGSVNYLESLRIMKESDWLLHIDANLLSVLDENIFFAAKLADYIGSSNKILAITMLEGASADHLRKYGAVVCSHSKEDISNYLYLILYKGYSHSINTQYQETLDAKLVAQKFDSIVKSLI